MSFAITNPSNYKVGVVSAQQRRHQSYLLLLKGWSRKDVAEHFGISYQAVLNDLSHYRKELQTVEEQRKEEAIAERDLAIARYELVIKDAWEQWEKSKLDHVKETTIEVFDKPTSLIQDEDGNVKHITSDELVATGKQTQRVVEGQCGDPAFLAIVIKSQRCIDSIRGHDAPTKSHMTGSLNVKQVIMNWDGLCLKSLRDTVTTTETDPIEAKIEAIGEKKDE